MTELITIINIEDFSSRVEVVPEDFWWFLTTLLPGTRIEIHGKDGLYASIVIGSEKKEGATE